MAGNRKKPQGRVARVLERVALGAVMTVAAFVVERRLLRAIRKRGEEEPTPPQPEREGLGVTLEDPGGGLSISTQEVHQQPGGDRPPQAAQDHRHPSRDV